MRAAMPYILMFVIVTLLTLVNVPREPIDRWTVGLVVFVLSIAWLGRRR